MNQGNASICLLNEIYQAADMGAQGCELLIGKTEDSLLLIKLQEYKSRYANLKNEAEELIIQKSGEPQKNNGIEKSRLWMGVQLNSLIDKTPSHIAEMLIQGSTMGVINGIKNKNAYPQAEPDCVELADKFLLLQQEHIEDMKQFL
jgi:hypothetical protein